MTVDPTVAMTVDPTVAMTVDPTVLTSSLPWTETRPRRDSDLAQWTGTATSSTASASGTTIGFGRR
jgi:hypothetical protein